MKALAKEMDDEAAKALNKKATASQRKTWKLAAARNFFFVLPPELQKELTEASRALQSGCMDTAAAEVLGLDWRPSSAEASASSCWPECKSTQAKRASGTRRLAKELADRIVSEAGSGDEAFAILQQVQARVASQWPEAARAAECNHCLSVGPALATFRGSLSGEALLNFDTAVTVSVAPSRRKVRKWGVPISKEKWEQAKAKRDGVVLKSRRGRPAALDNLELVKKVTDCINAHSQESSTWLESESRNARVLTTSLLRAYWDSDLPASLGWAQFHKIVRAKCTWAIRPVRKTDYCDYCHLFQSSILPGLEKLMNRANDALTTVFPAYFRTFTEPPSSETVARCEAMSRYIRSHSDVQRNERRTLTASARQTLHELEAKVSHQMAWELKVAKSYEWHSLVAQRQAQSVQRDLEALSEEQVLLWSDYKQNLSLPQANVQTGDMFYGTSRMELTCWGCLLFQRKGGVLNKKHIVILSSIIEHSSLVSNLLCLEAAKHFDAWEKVKEVLAWSDCGPHYKSYDHIAGWLADWVEASPPRSVRLSFFGEKHGKGQVDGLFGVIEGWLKNFLKKPGSRIATPEELEAVLRAEARRANAIDAACQHIIVRWEPELKPLSAWVLPDKQDFQISKTYCLQLVPGNPRLRVRNTAIVDYTFSDMAGQHGNRSFPKVETEEIADRAWRRGYFSNTRWNKKVPARGESDTMMGRYDEHLKRKMQPPSLESQWEKAARKQANRLLRRRTRWSRMKEAATSRQSQSSDSDSSSSSSSPSSNEG
ncbi:unnamed protein product [Effrenium voratum]|nr:unnamed protein product [Effrenium voratum]